MKDCVYEEFEYKENKVKVVKFLEGEKEIYVLCTDENLSEKVEGKLLKFYVNN